MIGAKILTWENVLTGGRFTKHESITGQSFPCDH